jgi:hypothetical protein
MDREFNFIRVNNAYAQGAGHPADYFPGKNHFALYPNAENREIFERVVRTGEAFSVYEKAFENPEYPDRGVTYWDWRWSYYGDMGLWRHCLASWSYRVQAEERWS